MRPTLFPHRLVRLAALLLGAVVISLWLGCSSLDNFFGTSKPVKPKVSQGGGEVVGRLRSGDQIQVRLDFSGLPTQSAQSLDLSIDENGEILLPLVGHIQAADLTASELCERIQANYVPRYYVRCTATVLVAQRFFYIGGEVRNPGRFPWSEDTTLLKAISTASGFTDYANRSKVELVHADERHVYNCEDLQRNPVKDPLVRPGDTITVPRSIF